MSVNKETTSDSQRHIKQLWFRAKRARQCSALQLSESKRSTVHCTYRIDTLCAFICLDIYIYNVGRVLFAFSFVIRSCFWSILPFEMDLTRIRERVELFRGFSDVELILNTFSFCFIYLYVFGNKFLFGHRVKFEKWVVEKRANTHLMDIPSRHFHLKGFKSPRIIACLALPKLTIHY